MIGALEFRSDKTFTSSVKNCKLNRLSQQYEGMKYNYNFILWKCLTFSMAGTSSESGSELLHSVQMKIISRIEKTFLNNKIENFPLCSELR